MSKIIYKVAPPGEGKTQWLVDKANVEVTNGNKCYFLCFPSSTKEYQDFCDMYRAYYNKVCPVMPLELMEDIDETSCIFIDEAMSNELIGSIIKNLKSRCSKIYVTLEGYTSTESCSDCSKNDPEQVSIFDCVNEVN